MCSDSNPTPHYSAQCCCSSSKARHLQSQSQFQPTSLTTYSQAKLKSPPFNGTAQSGNPETCLVIGRTAVADAIELDAYQQPSQSLTSIQHKHCLLFRHLQHHQLPKPHSSQRRLALACRLETLQLRRLWPQLPALSTSSATAILLGFRPGRAPHESAFQDQWR